VNKLGVGIGFSKAMRKLSEKDIGVAISSDTKDRALFSAAAEKSRSIFVKQTVMQLAAV
jgi:hypothetical protein